MEISAHFHAISPDLELKKKIGNRKKRTTQEMFTSSSISISSKNFVATFSKASSGHSVNQSIVQQFIKDGNILQSKVKVGNSFFKGFGATVNSFFDKSSLHLP